VVHATRIDPIDLAASLARGAVIGERWRAL